MHIVSQGDLFSVPLNENVAALCRVAFASEYFKDVILVTVHGYSAPETDAVEQANTPIRAKVYCSSVSLQRGVWAYLANTPAKPEDKEISRRIVGGDVWVGDQHIGPPNRLEGNLPQMDVYGDRVLVKYLSRVLGA